MSLQWIIMVISNEKWRGLQSERTQKETLRFRMLRRCVVFTLAPCRWCQAVRIHRHRFWNILEAAPKNYNGVPLYDCDCALHCPSMLDVWELFVALLILNDTMFVPIDLLIKYPCVHSAEKLCPLNRLQTQRYTTK